MTVTIEIEDHTASAIRLAHTAVGAVSRVTVRELFQALPAPAPCKNGDRINVYASNGDRLTVDGGETVVRVTKDVVYTAWITDTFNPDLASDEIGNAIGQDAYRIDSNYTFEVIK